MFRKDLGELIGAFFLISLGGFLLHLRIHPVSVSAFNWLAVSFAAVNTFVLPMLFHSPRTTPGAYVFTWATVVVGTVGMAFYSVTSWKLPPTVTNILLSSTFPDIVILWAKLLIAHKILRVHWPHGVAAEGRRGCES
jgi:predicted ABC-type exoprotein transport system permease subunit